MYWYTPGVELLFCILVKDALKICERLCLYKLKQDTRFSLVKGREYFTGPVHTAIDIIISTSQFLQEKV